jgi:hypothetical protein
LGEADSLAVCIGLANTAHGSSNTDVVCSKR